MLVKHKEVAIALGMSPENIIVPDNGSIIEIVEEGKKMVSTKRKSSSRTNDG